MAALFGHRNNGHPDGLLRRLGLLDNRCQSSSSEWVRGGFTQSSSHSSSCDNMQVSTINGRSICPDCAESEEVDLSLEEECEHWWFCNNNGCQYYDAYSCRLAARAQRGGGGGGGCGCAGGNHSAFDPPDHFGCRCARQANRRVTFACPGSTSSQIDLLCAMRAAMRNGWPAIDDNRRGGGIIRRNNARLMCKGFR